jgi:electron transfer flavoprotein alpha subunit
MDTLSNVSGGVWVFSESKQTVFELLGGGRTLAGASGVPLISMVIGTESDARECIAYGADQVFLLPVSDQSPLEAYAGTISELAKSYKPELLMIGATNRGKTLAAMIAGDLASGCSTDCKEIARDETGRITVKRLIFGGAGVVTETNGAGPFVVTVGARSYRPLVKDDSRKGVIHHAPCDFATYPVRVVKHLQKTRSAVDVTAAETLVVVGRGLVNKKIWLFSTDLRRLSEELWVAPDRFRRIDTGFRQINISAYRGRRPSPNSVS